MLSVFLFEHGSEYQILSPKFQTRLCSLFESILMYFIHCMIFRIVPERKFFDHYFLDRSHCYEHFVKAYAWFFRAKRCNDVEMQHCNRTLALTSCRRGGLIRNKLQHLLS